MKIQRIAALAVLSALALTACGNDNSSTGSGDKAGGEVKSVKSAMAWLGPALNPVMVPVLAV